MSLEFQLILPRLGAVKPKIVHTGRVHASCGRLGASIIFRSPGPCNSSGIDD